MTKIIILCSNFEPGGAQRAALRLNTQLNKNGFKSEVWFFHPKSHFDCREPYRVLSEQQINTPVKFFSFLKTLHRGLKTEKPDVVISFLPYANLIGLLVAKFAHVKLRIASHRNLSVNELSLPFRIIDFVWANRGIYTSITAVSHSTKESFKYYGSKKYEEIKVVNNGLSFKPSNLTKEESRIKFGLPKNKFIMGTVGRLVKQKNQLLLINILPSLPDVFLTIVGKGELQPALEARAEELNVRNRLLIIPNVETESIPDFYNALDIYAMPSLFEGLSNAMIEALSAGLPIVSSDIGPQRDALVRSTDNFTAGALLSNESPESWIETITKIKIDENYRDHLRNSALQRSKDFTLEKMAEGFQTLFQ